MAQDGLGPNERLTSLVFMGMGEPLANSTEVADAITRLTSDVWDVHLALGHLEPPEPFGVHWLLPYM